MGFVKIALKKRGKEPNNVKILSSTDELRELNDEVTEKLKKWKMFDLDVPVRRLGGLVGRLRLNSIISVIEKRNLVWADPGFGDYEGKRTIVVGVRGSDFAQHERDR